MSTGENNGAKFTFYVQKTNINAEVITSVLLLLPDR